MTVRRIGRPTMPLSTHTAHEAARRAQARAVRNRRRRSRRPGAEDRQPPATSENSGRSPTQRQGHAAENRAADFLRARGLAILQRNLRCRAGELDLIAREGDLLVFVEVRTRSDHRYGGAVASVNRDKQRRLLRAAAFFLPRLTRCYFAGRTPICRFDVVCIQNGELEWIRHAFAAER